MRYVCRLKTQQSHCSLRRWIVWRRYLSNTADPVCLVPFPYPHSTRRLFNRSLTPPFLSTFLQTIHDEVKTTLCPYFYPRAETMWCVNLPFPSGQLFRRSQLVRQISACSASCKKSSGGDSTILFLSSSSSLSPSLSFRLFSLFITFLLLFFVLLFSLFWILNAPMYARYKKHRHWVGTGTKPWYGQPRTNCWIWLTHVICFLEHPWKNGRFSRKTEEVRRRSLSFVCCFVFEYNIC